MAGQFVSGAATLFVARTEKVKPGAFMKLNFKVADVPEPVMVVEPGVMVIGVMTVGAGMTATKLVAERLLSSLVVRRLHFSARQKQRRK